MTEATGKQVGRPRAYKPSIGDEIIRRICEGEPLRQICLDDNMPARSTVALWIVDNIEGFSDRYKRAKMADATDIDDMIMHAAFTGTGDVARDRLIVDTLKWKAQKRNPKVFGEKLPTDSDGKDVPVVHFSRTVKETSE